MSFFDTVQNFILFKLLSLDDNETTLLMDTPNISRSEI